MSALSSFTILMCCVGVGVSMLSVLVPQKRTKRILGFILGLFVILSVVSGIRSAVGEWKLDDLMTPDGELPTYSESDYSAEVAQQTADILVTVVDDLLRGEGVIAENIRLTVKISDEGRIYADRVVIYITEPYRERKRDIETIIYRNLSKEPEIYVKEQETQRSDNG